VVLRLGASPTSAALQRWLFHHNGVDHVVVDDGGRWKDHGATATRYVVTDTGDFLHRAAGLWADPSDPAHALERAEPGWADRWHRAETAAREALEGHECLEGAIAGHVIATLPAGASLFVSSSMPIRDVDAFGHPREGALSVVANRGASGIDGVVSSAFGVASQRDGPTVCLIGDLAFFHDRNGLLWSREADAVVVFVLVDNDGGGIFHMLPIAEHEPEFTRLFATPHGVEPGPVARGHGIPCEQVEVDGLAAALERAVEVGETAIIRVCTDRAANRRGREAVETVAPRSVRKALVQAGAS